MITNSLFYNVRESREDSGRNKAIILLHGVGSNEESMFGFSDYLPTDYYIICPRGPLTFSPGHHGWFTVNFSSGNPIYDKEQEASSRAILTDFINEIKELYKLEEIYIGGFSQGAIMSYTIGLTQPEKVKGVMALGGRILQEIRPVVEISDALSELKVFTGHGVADNMLPIQFAREAKDYLVMLPVELTYKEYNTGHQVIPEMLADVNKWIKRNTEDF